MNEAVKGCQH